MKALTLALIASLVAGGALAQPRLSTTGLACGQAAGLVTARGAIVLGTGGYTYDRFVRDRSFCQLTEVTEPAWAPTADNPQCFIGYRCKEADPFWNR